MTNSRDCLYRAGYEKKIFRYSRKSRSPTAATLQVFKSSLPNVKSLRVQRNATKSYNDLKAACAAMMVLSMSLLE